MAVRRIPKNHLVVTGAFASRKSKTMAQFESPLEKDYLLLLDFDDQVATFETQPVLVPVPGVPRGYVPDVLVHFHTDMETGEIPSPLLVEIKHTDDLQRHALKYAVKFAAAEQYARARGWRFEVIDQRQIRTARLANLKFLRAFRTQKVSEDVAQTISKALIAGGGNLPLSSLLSRLQRSPETGQRLPAVWVMIATGRLHVNLDAPLGTDPLISLPGAQHLVNRECV